jgi:hypothetical protein
MGGEFESLVGDDRGALWWRGTAAGEASRGGGLRVASLASICCELEPIEGIRGCAGAEGRGCGQREESGYRWLVGFDGFPGQSLRTPASYSGSLGAI